jgi:hypothetical protein
VCARYAASRRSEPAAIGRALRAGVADRSEHVPLLRDRLVWSDAGRRILTGDGEGALAGRRLATRAVIKAPEQLLLCSF